MTDDELKELAENIYYGYERNFFHYHGDVDAFVSDLISWGDGNGCLAELNKWERQELQCLFEELIEQDLEETW